MKQRIFWIPVFLILALGCLGTSLNQRMVTRAGETAAAAAAETSMEESIDTADGGIVARLAELDAQIAQDRARMSESTGQGKAAADSERKLWETELERILAKLEEALSSREMTALLTAQKEWKREREALAAEASKNQRSAVLEELEYNASLAESTRQRVYELAETYEDILSDTE
ncbi:MAG: DUF1311 domain-containing protein [Clostridiales bacterium]|nr:DUF1311 domain-containing protein [Clostridiales bacterium]